jgi:O-methyltransferase/methyltransferase family protein
MMSENRDDLPSPEPIVDLIEAFRRSKTLFTAVSMGVFDRLDQAAATVEELAGDAHIDAVTRLLDACVALRVLEKAGARYRNSGLAATYLCRRSPHSLAGYILYSDRALFPMWSHLEDAVREGSNRWNQTFEPAAGNFLGFYRTPEARADFLRGMHGFGMISSPAVVSAFDLSSYSRFVDLGGATGHLAAAVRKRYPQMRTAVYDLQEVVEFASAEYQLEGVEWIGGDFFSDALPAADIFGLGRILHDWDVERITTLLTRISQALPSGGGLLLAEKLLSPEGDGPVSACMQSLNMLICTEGRERSLDEYRLLLEGAGFCDVEGVRTGTPLDAVFARKSSDQ